MRALWSAPGLSNLHRTSKARKGDRAYLVKLGNQGRGIFASGTFQEKPEAEGDFGLAATIRWEVFLDPRRPEFLLSVDTLRRDPALRDQHWTPQSSGNRIRPGIAPELEKRWLFHVRAAGAETSAPEFEGLEGEAKILMITHRVREGTLREAKLREYRAAHGTLACEVCGFDFETVFGIAYAEVHHLRPLASLKKATANSTSDLAVLCSNCHSMAHNGPQVRSVRELRRMRAAAAE